MRRQDTTKASVSAATNFAQASARHEPKSTPAPRITLRLSEEENAKLRDFAADMSVSAYVRKCLFDGDLTPRKRRSYMPVKDQQALAQLLALLGASRIANNLNQLAYHANTGSLAIDDEARGQIDETYIHVRQIRDTLIAALGLIES